MEDVAGGNQSECECSDYDNHDLVGQGGGVVPLRTLSLIQACVDLVSAPTE